MISVKMEKKIQEPGPEQPIEESARVWAVRTLCQMFGPLKQLVLAAQTSGQREEGFVVSVVKSCNLQARAYRPSCRRNPCTGFCVEIKAGRRETRVSRDGTGRLSRTLAAEGLIGRVRSKEA